MGDVAAREGYGAASIAKVIARAGVSRPTFYEYFTDKDDCFLAAVAEVQQRLLADAREAIALEEPGHALDVVVRTLVAFATTEPDAARFLMTETLAAGYRSMDTRYHGIAQIGGLIEDAYRHLAPDAIVPDISGRILTGGIYRLLSARLRREQPELAALRDELPVWVKAYDQPLGEHRWRTLEPVRTPAPAPAMKIPPLLPPLALPARRRGASSEGVAENHRQRILFAAAELARRDGYRSATISEITKLAGLDSHAFYRLFNDKQQVYAAVHDLYFQHLMANTAGAFFSGASWPERVWQAGQAFTQTFEQNPTLAHVGFVEAYSAGPDAERRLDEFLSAFTVFLKQGYEDATHSPRPTPVALEAIGSANFEMARHQVRHSGPVQLSSLLPHVVYLCIAPFLGAGEANAFIDRKLEGAVERG
jgi:AcrR family transcriptional regulator